GARGEGFAGGSRARGTDARGTASRCRGAGAGRFREGLLGNDAGARGCSDGPVKPQTYHGATAPRGPCGKEPATGSVPVEAGRGIRGPDVLWTKRSGSIPARRHVRGQDLEGKKAGRLARRATDEVRAGHQPQGRQSARADDPAVGAGAGG